MNFWHIDVFTKEPFKGNPAAVVLLHKPLSDKRMQSIAKEMNLSETAFVLIEESKLPSIRWFTPTFEIDLCGHATIAAAYVLMQKLYTEKEELIFQTKESGTLFVKKMKETFTLELPKRPGVALPIENVPEDLCFALANQRPIAAYQARDLMLVYENEELIRQMQPDFHALLPYKTGIIVTSKSEGNYDFISRYFCANDAIQEDPVTGSAYCTLAPYWANDLGKTEFKAYQASERGGEVQVSIHSKGIDITGHVVEVSHGTYSAIVEVE